jgi:tRNA (cmo5U34)-methyltransferase
MPAPAPAPLALPAVDRVAPTGRWTFDAEVTACFDDMLARSIPDLAGMRADTFAVARSFVQHRTEIVDLGCSRGEALEPFVRQFGAFNHYTGVECSPAMLTASRERFAGLIDRRVVEIRDEDLRLGYPPVKASVTLCVLTLQFTPIEHRQRILADIYRSTVPGGCLLLVEKVLGSTAAADAALVGLHHAAKRAAGYSADDVARKRLALEGVLVPLTAAWDEELLRSAGFASVDCYWRRLNFAGWLAVRAG